jgi:glycerophosphoryl diester phosphodiesterase
MKKDLSWLTERPIAHRGLHDQNKAVWENTSTAFRRAIEHGYAIECDLQYVSDGRPVVFHDDDLERLCNIKGDVRLMTSGELGLLSIGGTADKIPTLRQLLSLTAGRVPLVIELKGREHDDDGFADAVLETLESYDGAVALMSFDVWLLKDLKGLDCRWPVGLTAEGVKPVDFVKHREAMSLGLDFISYNVMHLPNEFIASERSRMIPIITWTVTNEALAAHTYAHANQITFEGFLP